MRIVLLAVLSALIAGCATTGASPEQVAEYERTIPECTNDKECERMWSAARRWILNNAAYRLQHVTPEYLATYNPPQHSSLIAFRASKEPTDAGHRIVGEAWCNNMFGCNPGRYDAMIDFNQTVGQAR